MDCAFASDVREVRVRDHVNDTPNVVCSGVPVGVLDTEIRRQLMRLTSLLAIHGYS